MTCPHLFGLPCLYTSGQFLIAQEARIAHMVQCWLICLCFPCTVYVFTFAGRRVNVPYQQKRACSQDHQAFPRSIGIAMGCSISTPQSLPSTPHSGWSTSRGIGSTRRKQIMHLVIGYFTTSIRHGKTEMDCAISLPRAHGLPYSVPVMPPYQWNALPRSPSPGPHGSPLPKGRKQVFALTNKSCITYLQCGSFWVMSGIS